MDHRVRYLTDSSKLSRMGRCELSSTKTIKNDLRWRRTERSLMSSLGTQLSRTPLDKVKVTELCRDADVSKATFYLHYCDIYDLADAFVDARVETVIDELGDPCLPFQDVGSFVRRFVEVFTSDDQKRFLRLADENHMAPRFLNRFWRKLGEKLEAALRFQTRRGFESRCRLSSAGSCVPCSPIMMSMPMSSWTPLPVS